MKKGLKLFIMLIGVCMFCATSSQSMAKVKVKKVTVKSNYGSSVHVAVGKKIKLSTTVKVTPNKSANKKVTYKSSNKKIATVSSSGYVKGVKVGKCKVTVTSTKNKKKKAKITINVVKKVTSISITEPENPLFVGNSKTLKATVNPESGSYKKVIWTSSDKTVASVSSAGTVKGLKPGNVTIKATSVEGSKISKSLKMTVLSLDSVYILDSEVLSNNTVRVVLHKPYPLTKEQFLVQGKKYANGKYTRSYVVEKVRNYDNQTYDLTLDSHYTIEEDSYVQVAIASLPGNGRKVSESQAIFVRDWQPRVETWTGLVGDHWDKVVDLSEYCYGNIKYEVTGSIPGINIIVKNNELRFEGELTTIVVGSEITIKATDEMRNSITKKILVTVGNEKTVAARAENCTILMGEEIEKQKFAEATGGSGEYLYSAINLPMGLQLNQETGEITGKAISVGEYNVQVTVVDRANESRTSQCSAVIQVMDQKKVVGKVQDAAGKGVSGATIICENISNGCVYQTKTDENGNYSIYVAEGSYNIQAIKDDCVDSVYKVAIGAGGRQLLFSFLKTL